MTTVVEAGRGGVVPRGPVCVTVTPSAVVVSVTIRNAPGTARTGVLHTASWSEVPTVP